MKKKRLLPVLPVCELPWILRRRRQHLPSIKTLASEHAQVDQEKLVTYLSRGKICAFTNDRYMKRDVFAPAQKTVTSIIGWDDEEYSVDSLLTDGHWVWSVALIYYVKNYNVRLPDDFVRHARSKAFEISQVDIDGKTLDTSAWHHTPGNKNNAEGQVT